MTTVGRNNNASYVPDETSSSSAAAPAPPPEQPGAKSLDKAASAKCDAQYANSNEPTSLKKASLSALHLAAQKLPFSPEECKKMPDTMLEQNARILRNRLGAGTVEYAGRSADLLGLKAIENEQAARLQLAKQAASAAPDPKPTQPSVPTREQPATALPPPKVEICKRMADVWPNNKFPEGMQGDHWWIRTNTKNVGMGETNGNLPGLAGQGALPATWSMALIDHTHDHPRECTPIVGVDEACINEKLVIGQPEGKWVPPVNDCHTVVHRIIDECRTEKETKESAKSGPINGADAGAPLAGAN